MKVAIISPYDLGLPGGVQDQAIRLSGWLDRLVHDSVLIGPGEVGPEGAVLLGSTRTIKANRAATPIALNPRFSKKLKEAVADVDVVHIHEPLMPLVSTAATSIKTHPTVGTFHADPPTWARIGYRVGSSVWRKAINRLDVVTTVSHVSGSAISPFVSARVIPNGIDVADYSGGVKIPYRVAFLGRDDERKGLQVLLDAWPSVLAAVPEAELRVIGANRDEEHERVTFLGRVDGADKATQLGSAAVFCAPNLGGESFGIVVAEGMASGCLVIASNTGGIPSMISQQVSGILIEPANEFDLSKAVLKLLQDNQTAKAMVKSGFLWQERYAIWENIGRRICDSLFSLASIQKIEKNK